MTARRLLSGTAALTLAITPALADDGPKPGVGVTSLGGQRGAINQVPVSALPAPTVYPFAGDGSTTGFTLPAAIDGTKATVSVGGILQVASSYTITGATLTFGVAPPAGTAIVVTSVGLTAGIPSLAAQGAAPIASPAFTGAPTAPTPAITDASTRLATTAALFAALPTVNLAMYGADMTGVADACASAIPAALAALPAAGGTILFPPGDLRVNAGCIITSNKPIRKVGMGSGVSRIHCYGTTADCMSDVETAAVYPVSIEHLSIYPEVVASGHAAMNVNYANSLLSSARGPSFSDLEIGKGNDLTNYFTYGLRCNSCFNAGLANVNIHGKNEGNPPAGISAANMDAGIYETGHSIAFTKVGLYVTFANYGIHAAGDVQGNQEFGCNLIAVNYGWYYDDASNGDPTSTPEDPGPQITNCDTATYKGGFVGKGWSQFMIGGSSTFYKRPESANNWVSVDLQDGIYGGTVYGSNLNIVQNSQIYGFIQNRGQVGGTAGTAEAVRLGPNASGNQVQDNSINGVDYAFDCSSGAGFNRFSENQGFYFSGSWAANCGSSPAIFERNYPLVIGTDTGVQPLPAGTTPSLGGSNDHVFNTANTTAVTVTSLLNGYAGEEIRIRGNDGGKTTLQHNAGLLLKGQIPVTLANGQVVTLLNEGVVWEEQSRNF